MALRILNTTLFGGFYSFEKHAKDWWITSVPQPRRWSGTSGGFALVSGAEREFLQDTYDPRGYGLSPSNAFYAYYSSAAPNFVLQSASLSSATFVRYVEGENAIFTVTDMGMAHPYRVRCTELTYKSSVLWAQ